MRNRKFITLIFSALVFFTLIPGINSKAAISTKGKPKTMKNEIGQPVERKVIAYFQEWTYSLDRHDNYTADKLPWDKLTHINYAFAGVNAKTNKIDFCNKVAAIEMEFPGQTNKFPYKGHFNVLNSYKLKYPNVKTLISVGGGGGNVGFYTMTDTANTREIFANSCVEFIRNYGFNGIDLDFEYPTSTPLAGSSDDPNISESRRGVIYNNYVELVKLLREKLDEASKKDNTKYILSAALSASSWVLGGMGLGEYAEYLDFANIMTYDFHGAWNEEGFLNKGDDWIKSSELNREVLNQIFSQTKEVKSNMYLWGGEPLCYTYWDEVVSLLEKDKRWTIICTNGILIDKKLNSILKISDNVVLLISVDGFEEENDAIRGKGTFKKVIENIKLLLHLKKKGIFKGEISVNCVITEAMVDKLYDFIIFFENLGINTLYFGYPWYLPEDISENMDKYFKENFSWLKTLNDDYIASWHSYKYHLNKAVLNVLLAEIKKLNSRDWNIRIRFQPALEIPQIENFILGKETIAQRRKCCLAISNRMNVLPSGKITVCKNFPKFTIGDLNNEKVKDLWHNDNFRRCREILSSKLTPVCSKCVLLYLHGI